MSVLAFSCSKSKVPKTEKEAIDENAKKIYPQYVALEKREQNVDRTVWAKELEAERCGRVFEDLWDALNASTNKLETLSGFAVAGIVLPEFSAAKGLPHGIEVFEPSGRGQQLDQNAWVNWIKAAQKAGWRLGATEFRHVRFDMASPHPVSEFYLAGELSDSATTNRAVIEGSVLVYWHKLASDDAPPSVHHVDASRLGVRARRGEPPMEKMVDEIIPPRDKWPFVDPLIVCDLDNDGRLEIVLAARNVVAHLENWEIKTSTLCQVDPGLIHTAQVADFNGDGYLDFLCVKGDGLFLYEGSGHGTFDRAPRMVWKPPAKIQYALAMTCGDIDGDGDLDVWLTQYKVPYLLGQLATPYYDANDGYPSYLLKNDGAGDFTDATVESGLAAKRHRRTYSASFADLDGDGDLDLAVVSDFCGVDLYRNDGKGKFADVTREWAGEPYLPGMAHAISDFNNDGAIDLLAIGMTSPAVDRLEHLSLKRGDSRVDESKRGKLMVGNRLLISKAGGGFSETSLSASIARSGWSWGCGAADFDNDGFVDVYIANGHETLQSVRDYDPQFWLHDVYIGNSSDSAVNLVYFAAKSTATRGRGYSYGGWERNRFYWNDRGEKFREIGGLLGVSIQQDSRNVVACDLDADGRVDLLVTTYEAWPQQKQTLKIFRNKIGDAGNWIGVRLKQQAHGLSPVGARVILETSTATMVREVVTGDSYRSQHPNTVHFGLGSATNVDAIRIRWTNGRVVEFKSPPINRYFDAESPGK